MVDKFTEGGSGFGVVAKMKKGLEVAVVRQVVAVRARFADDVLCHFLNSKVTRTDYCRIRLAVLGCGRADTLGQVVERACIATRHEQRLNIWFIVKGAFRICVSQKEPLLVKRLPCRRIQRATQVFHEKFHVPMGSVFGPAYVCKLLLFMALQTTLKKRC